MKVPDELHLDFNEKGFLQRAISTTSNNPNKNSVVRTNDPINRWKPHSVGYGYHDKFFWIEANFGEKYPISNMEMMIALQNGNIINGESEHPLRFIVRGSQTVLVSMESEDYKEAAGKEHLKGKKALTKFIPGGIYKNKLDHYYMYLGKYGPDKVWLHSYLNKWDEIQPSDDPRLWFLNLDKAFDASNQESYHTSFYIEKGNKTVYEEIKVLDYDRDNWTDIMKQFLLRKLQCTINYVRKNNYFNQQGYTYGYYRNTGKSKEQEKQEYIAHAINGYENILNGLTYTNEELAMFEQAGFKPS